MNLKTYKYKIFGLNNKQIIDLGRGRISGTHRTVKNEPIVTIIRVPGGETEKGLKKHSKIMTGSFSNLKGDIKINTQETE